MDPIGFGLENFDLQGRYRTKEPDHPECTIGGVGEVTGVGSFSGPAELADRLLLSGELNHCLISQVYRFVTGRAELDDVDARFIGDIETRLGGPQASFRWSQLLEEIFTSQAFLHRRVSP
jgi:hypothetical protein